MDNFNIFIILGIIIFFSSFLFIFLLKTILSLSLILKVAELKKINESENIQNLTIKDIEIIWLMQEAIEKKKLLEFFTNIE